MDMVDMVLTQIWISGRKSRSVNNCCPAARFGSVSPLGADLLGGPGVGDPQFKVKLHVARECSSSILLHSS